MTGTRWVLFVIPAKAGIQSTRLSRSSEPLNLGLGKKMIYDAWLKTELLDNFP
jgi:hypothetical protein